MNIVFTRQQLKITINRGRKMEKRTKVLTKKKTCRESKWRMRVA
jgi:hypothetical protein